MDNKEKPEEQQSILKRARSIVTQALIPNSKKEIVLAIRLLAALTIGVLGLVLVRRYGLGTSMSPENVAAILTAVAWPITVLGIVLLFRPSIRSFLDTFANSARATAVKFTIFGLEVELPTEQAREVLDEIGREILDTINELDEEEVKLLRDIVAAEGKLTVLEIDEHFERTTEREENLVHKRLQHLRRLRLIRPHREKDRKGELREGKWHKDKRPILTRFGRLALSLEPKLRRQLQRQQNSPPDF